MNHTLFVIIAILGGLLFVNLICLFLISRKSQRVMRDLLEIMTSPEQAKVQNATRVLQTILKDEIDKIDNNFKSMSNALQNQITHTETIKDSLTVQNDKLVNISEEAVKKIANMSQRIENTVDGLNKLITSSQWIDVQTSADSFNNNLSDLLNKMKFTAEETNKHATDIQEHINSCVEKEQEISSQLQESLKTNQEDMDSMTKSAQDLQQQLSDLSSKVAEGFEAVKTSSSEYDETMHNNDKMLNSYLIKLSEFKTKFGKDVIGYTNTLKETSDLVYAASRLGETSLQKHLNKLETMKTSLDESTVSAQSTFRETTQNMATLGNMFKKELKDFSFDIVKQIQDVSTTATDTLENTKSATTDFADSIKSMGISVHESLKDIKQTHAQLAEQSDGLIKMSSSTTEQLKPLSELIEKYYKALPDLTQGSQEMSDNVQKIVDTLVDKINMMKTTLDESLTSMQTSSTQLGELSGQSRQQMIDLMRDYTKAVEAMQSLNKQMMIARASAPMDAIKVTPNASFKPISTKDFMGTVEGLFEKLYTQSVDLTRSIGSDIPAVVWKKYNDGDNKIFAKWLIKVFAATNKKQIRDLLKNDKVFNSQATQFVRNFEKILAGANQTNDADKAKAALLKTDLGSIYNTLHNNM